jgi:hypothetical protein
MLYSPAKARFQTKLTINQTTGNKTFIRGLADEPPEDVIHHKAASVQNNRAATHNQTIIPIKILPKKDQNVTSFGALSNIATSGFFIDFGV